MTPVHAGVLLEDWLDAIAYAEKPDQLQAVKWVDELKALASYRANAAGA